MARETGQAVTLTRTYGDGPGECSTPGHEKRQATGRSGRLCKECVQSRIAGFQRLLTPGTLKRAS